MGKFPNATQKFIEIVVDSNDEDHVVSVTPIKEEHLEIIAPLIEKISNFESYEGYNSLSGHRMIHSHNYPYMDRLMERSGEMTIGQLYPDMDCECELLENYLPQLDRGFHSILSIMVYEKINVKKLL